MQHWASVKTSKAQLLLQGASLTQLHLFTLEFFDCLELQVNPRVITLIRGSCRHDCLNFHKANTTEAPHCSFVGSTCQLQPAYSEQPAVLS